VRELGVEISEAAPDGDTPLIVAAETNNLPMVQCLVELGADVNQVVPDFGWTPLTRAARVGNLAVVRCLVQLGARVEANLRGDTALLASAPFGRYATMQYLLEEAGATMDEVNKVGDSVWDKLIERLENAEDADPDDFGYVVEDPAALAAFLRVLVLRGAPPPVLVALLLPEPAHVVQAGARLRARLPVYLAHRRGYLDSRCPRISLLPGALRALIHCFEGPATTEELWATGLGTAPAYCTR
jgi:hypothetical protein